MLAGLALNLTDNGLEIVSRNTVSAQTWDGDFNNNAYWGGIDVNEEQLGNNDNSTHSTVEPLTPPPIEGFDTTGPDIPDIDIPDNDSGQADNSGSGYSDADDDGGYDDGMGENGDNGDNGYGDDTTDNQNDNEYDNGQNGEQDEVYDCMGILKGKAYVNQCGECIDGNKGQIYTDDEKAKSLLNELKKGCFIQTLLSILDANSGVTIVAH